MNNSYDFSGWATRANIRCSDGRVIAKDAFLGNDKQKVPLVWNHQHNDPLNVLGHALLENRDEGVYAYCEFNNTESGQTAKELVQHGDICALSIYANQLQQNGSTVVHGVIREVSLVHAGANRGATIEEVIRHGEVLDDEAYIFTDENIYLEHSDKSAPEKKEEQEKPVTNNDETVADVFNTLSEKQKNVVYALIGMALEGKSGSSEKAVAHADTSDDGETVADVFNTLSEKQKTVVYALIGQALEEADNTDDSKEDNSMKHNVFDQDTNREDEALIHSQMETIIADGKRFGSLKDSYLAHAEEYGIDNIDYLFPEDRNLDSTPQFISREMGWVQKVMGAVHHSPFSRVKSMFADITEDEARAKGYIKGNLKKEEVFSLLKRSTTPTTVYKKQKMDRDDVLDITNMDVVAWLKSEMRMMLDEELARAYLIGDGRLASDDDHIDPTHIRPIVNDASLFVVRWSVDDGASEDDLAKNFIRAAIKSRKDYKGSGNPTLFTTEDMLTNMLLLEDTIGHRLYKTEAELATALRVREIVTVPVMEGFEDKDSKDVYGIIVNLADYNVGADKGGAVSMFDDFDIDYNQQKYLIETRCSGALTKPFSAIVLREGSATAKDSVTLAQAKAELDA